MRRLLLLAGLLVAAPACSPPSASGAVLSVMAVGDTAKVFAHWGAVPKATGYTYTLSVVTSNGTWTGLPVSVATAGTTMSAFPVSSGADTAVFQLCVTAQGVSGTSSPGCTPSTASAANTWRRKLGIPQPVMDSVSAIFLLPSTLRDTLAIGDTVGLCPFFQLGNGAVGMRQQETQCVGAYQTTYSALQRTLTLDQQGVVNNQCLLWHNSMPSVATFAVASPGCDVLVGMLPRQPIPPDVLGHRV